MVHLEPKNVIEIVIMYKQQLHGLSDYYIYKLYK